MSGALRNGRATAVATATAPIRCGVYCRKSTTEGLDQEFTSLDNQRQAAEAYVASQRHAGWVALPERYDDGGYTGANTNRPALQRLLADIELGRIDCVLVYKYDRLSRTMLDFLTMLEFFKKHRVSFVSVSQRFDTSTPVGEMTLNMLLSFAQFERKLISERTKDKMSAARRRGRWTGGFPVLGFDVAPEGRRLIVNRDEAAQVKTIFTLYAERRSLIDVANLLNERGWRTKSWTTKGGRRRDGRPWDKVSVHKLLSNPLLAGFQKLRGETFAGEHDAIVSKKLFQEVQSILRSNRVNGGASVRNSSGALLRGLLHCAACGRAMTATWTRRGTRRYRYYVCTHAAKNGVAHCPTRSVPAEEIERFVVEKIRAVGADPALQAAVAAEAQKQTEAERKSLASEQKRDETERRQAAAEVQRLVAAVAQADGAASDALLAGLESVQSRVTVLGRRLAEIGDRLRALRDAEIDEADLRAALETFDPVWDALLVPERERVLRLLIESVTYDGRTEELTLHFHPLGISTLAAEVTPHQEAV